MTQVTIGFRAFDPHELLVHFVAIRCGLYSDVGIQPHLLDLTFVNPVPGEVIHVACGSAIVERLRGNPISVILVAARGPVFWLVGPDHASGPDALREGRIAGYPPGSPPDLFTRMFLRRAGIDPEVGITVDAARDDAARLGLMAHGEVNGALLSSLKSPAGVERLGYRVLATLSDRVRVPTTGLAIRDDQLGSDPVARVAQAHRRALQVIDQDQGVARDALVDAFHSSNKDADSILARLRPVLSGDGTIPESEATQAIEATAAELRSPITFGWADLYRFRDKE